MDTCSKVYLTNQAAVVVDWELYFKSPKGAEMMLYKTGDCTVGKGDTINLEDYLSDFKDPVVFYIKASVVWGKDCCTEEMIFDASSDRTISYELHGTTLSNHFTKVS